MIPMRSLTGAQSEALENETQVEDLMVDQVDLMVDLIVDLMEDNFKEERLGSTWMVTWEAPSVEKRMLHPLELEPNQSHLVNCSRQQQQLWQKARSFQFCLAARSSMQFREVKMQ